MKLITLISFLATAVFAQGPLTPPGEPAPTMKTLDEIHSKVAAVGERRTPISALPFTISAGGSYYLTGNLTSAGGDGITVTAGNVTIDLNGFAMLGAVGGRGITFAGIGDVRILNGSLRDWGTAIESLNSTRTLVEKVNVNECTTGAIVTTGPNCTVRDCTISFCGGHGIRVTEGAVVTGNVVRSSFNSGIRVEGINCEVRGNTIYNSTVGVELLSNRACVEGNSMKANTLGLRVVSSVNSIRRNSLANNGGNTIFAGNDVAPFEPAATSINPHANISY